MDHNKKKKRILKEFKLTEISAVDKPAQSPALVTIMKRNDDSIEKVYVMSGDTDGHTHLISIDMYSREDMGGYTSWTNDHDHPFVIHSNGNIEIGIANGHTHPIFPTIEQVAKKGFSEEVIKSVLALAKSSFKKPNAADIGGHKPEHIEEPNMPEILKADHDTALNHIETLKKSLATAVAIGTLSDSHKVHYSGLSAIDQVSFLAKSASERDIVLDEIAKADSVVYTAEDGTKFRKSDDPRMVNMAKRADDSDKELAKSQAAQADLRFEKRASDDFGNLPGESVDKVALLKAIATIEDKDSREKVEAILKSHSVNLEQVTKTFGTQTVVKVAGNAQEAAIKLESLAKAYVEKNPEVSNVDAYEIVGTANPDLYNQAVSG